MGAGSAAVTTISNINNNNEGKEFEDIEALQNRFKNLKTENEKLMQRKLSINKEMEIAR